VPLATRIPPPPDSGDLLSPDFVRRLDQLDVLSRKILQGKLRGERRSKRRGQSVEFADYRPYVAGDDLRFIDWNLYARLERLFLRLFMEEEDLSLSILIDTSRSMDYGTPSKFLFAKRLAAALGYVGLVNYNRVHLFGYVETLRDSLTGLRGRRPIPQMLDFLRGLPVPSAPGTLGAAASNLAAAARRFAQAQTQKGVVVVISDLLDKGDITAALKCLAGGRHDVFIVQVLSPQEIDPTQAALAGDLTLRDCEDGQTAEVSLTAALIKRYRATLNAHIETMRSACAKRDAIHLFCDSTTPFEELVLQQLRHRGMLG